MTIHEALFSPVRQPVMTACLFLLTLQMALMLASFRYRRSRRIQVLYTLHFLLSFVFFYLPMLEICWAINYPDGSKALPAVPASFGSLPLSVMILYESLSALILLAASRDLVRYRNTHPSFESIKETMDLLPAGIAYGKTDGSIVFRNLVMDDLSRTLTEKRLTDLTAFQKTAATENGMPLAMPDGSVWQLTSEKMEVEGEPYTQLIATDITEQAAITRELEEKNAKLRDIHMRLDIYNKQAERMIIAQELLTARMAVHNEVGNVLLESRHYLKDPSSFEEEKLLQALKNANTYLLREYEEDDTKREPLTDALEMAEAIGVDVVLSGMIPSENPYRSVLASAVSECASNTVKHADGDRLSVDIRNTDTDITYVLKSNGDAPAEPIRESGGLLSLRSLVEKERGTMQIVISPEYALIIRLPKER